MAEQSTVDRAVADLAARIDHLTDQLRTASYGLLRATGGGVPDIPPPAPLSLRQRRVLAAVASGYTMRQVGLRLRLTEHTVKTYMRAIRDQLGASNTAHAVAIAYQHGILGVAERPPEAASADA